MYPRSGLLGPGLSKIMASFLFAVDNRFGLLYLRFPPSEIGFYFLLPVPHRKSNKGIVKL